MDLDIVLYPGMQDSLGRHFFYKSFYLIVSGLSLSSIILPNFVISTFGVVLFWIGAAKRNLVLMLIRIR
jgi:hypothetical protein